ncbi:MAG: site-2 protease family protein [Acidimicrobiia bacterium]
MFVHSVSIGRFFGIEVRVDPSWLVVAFLFGWSFYAQFQHVFPGLSPTSLFLLSVVSVVIFFGSVLLHELSHSVMARRLGIPVEGITLFLFGGVTKTRMEASKPKDEFLVAVVGPLTSLAIAGVLWMLVNWGSVVIQGPVAYALGYLGWLNLGLGVFNLLPGFPLDGGRVLRSILWQTGGSLIRATRRAAAVGKTIAALMIGLGLVSVFAGDLGGLWLAAIGWFLFQAAVAVDQDVVLKSLLRELKARDLMSPNLVTIPWDATIRQAVDDYFLRYDHSAFPVVGQDLPGLLTLRAVRQIPKDQWDMREVWSAATGLDEACTVAPDTPMDQVMEKLRQQEQDRVLVVDRNHLLGIITPRDILRWVRRSEELGLARVDTGL